MNRRSFLAGLVPVLGFAQAKKNIDKLAPYYPTPSSIVLKMLELVDLKKGEKMFDLGSGDGRIVIMAAQKFKAQAVGVEFDRDLVKQSSDRIEKLGLSKTAQIIYGDLMEQDYSSADVLTGPGLWRMTLSFPVGRRKRCNT
jgi:tRNA1(Val) A37 N6-methylase TrmN6